jgi:hypothetical protein
MTRRNRQCIAGTTSINSKTAIIRGVKIWAIIQREITKKPQCSSLIAMRRESHRRINLLCKEVTSSRLNKLCNTISTTTTCQRVVAMDFLIRLKSVEVYLTHLCLVATSIIKVISQIREINLYTKVSRIRTKQATRRQHIEFSTCIK